MDHVRQFILVPCLVVSRGRTNSEQTSRLGFGIDQALNSEWTDLRWGSISGRDKVPSLYDAESYLPLETPTVAKNAKMPEVETELRAQIDRAKAAGIHLTHPRYAHGRACAVPGSF